MITYRRLWKVLIDKNMNKSDLIKIADLSTATVAKMSKNQFVSMEVIVKICKALGCEIQDVCEVVAEC